MIDHILVPIDFSDLSEKTARIAAGIATVTGAKISLLHAYLIPGYSGGMAYETFIPPIDEHIELINKQIDDFKDGIPELKDKHVLRVAVPGAVQDMIGSYVDDNHVDLVISGTKGASGFMKFLMGSHSERIEGEVSCPTLVIPEAGVLEGKMKIALAHDYTSSVSDNQYHTIAFFHKLFGAELVIVHVKKAGEEFSDEALVIDKLKDLDPSYYTIEGDDVVEALNNFVEKEKIGLLSLIYHNHSFLDRLFGKSTARELTYNTKIPLLVLK